AQGKPDINGKPYKSSGGVMVYNEELDGEVPEGWELKTIKDLSTEIICGITPPTNNIKNYGDYMPFLTIPDMHGKVFSNRTDRSLSVNGVKTQKNKTLPINS